MKGALALAAVVAAHLFVFAWLPADALPAYVAASRIAFKLLAAAACLWAAGTLSPGDYMRSFWALLGGSYLLLTAAEHLFCVPLMGGDPARAAVLWSSLLVAGNLVSVGASALLAYAARAAGVGLGGGSRLLWVALGLVAVAVPGFGLQREVQRALGGGGVEAWASVASYMCDVLVFVLLVPVLRFARRLAGGKLARPWWTFAAATLAWLLFDATEPVAALAPGAVALASEAARTLGTLLSGLAALYAWALVAEARAERSAAATPAPR